MNKHPEDKLRELNLVLPELGSPRGSFAPCVMSGHMLYLSGKGAPLREGDGPVPKVGAEVSAQGGSLPKGFAVEIEAVVEFE